MSGVINYRTSFYFTNNSEDEPWDKAPLQSVVVAGANQSRSDQTLSTSAEPVVLNEVNMGGMWLLRNLSTTGGEIIHLRDGAAGANIITLNPGERQGPIRLGTGIANLHAIAAAGTPTLRFWGFDP